MAKTNLNTALNGLRGSVDGWVYKQYSYGTVITRRPRMDQVVWSPAQQAHREQVRRAGEFYRSVVANPALKARFQAIADEKRIPLSAVTLQEFLRRQKPASP